MKNVLVISTSLRKGNSNALAEKFAEGAKGAGNNVEIVSLVGKNISFCRGCFACLSKGKCVINDDANEITEKMKNADVIAFATPVYYYSMSGQMKTLIDRANSLYDSDYKFKDIYLLASAAMEDEDTMDKTVVALEGWIECFDRAELKGVVKALGVNDVGDIEGMPVLDEAFEAGKNV